MPYHWDRLGSVGSLGHADIDTTLKIYAKVKDKESKLKISETMKGLIPVKEYS